MAEETTSVSETASAEAVPTVSNEEALKAEVARLHTLDLFRQKAFNDFVSGIKQDLVTMGSDVHTFLNGDKSAGSADTLVRAMNGLHSHVDQLETIGLNTAADYMKQVTAKDTPANAPMDTPVVTAGNVIVNAGTVQVVTPN